MVDFIFLIIIFILSVASAIVFVNSRDKNSSRVKYSVIIVFVVVFLYSIFALIQLGLQKNAPNLRIQPKIEDNTSNDIVSIYSVETKKGNPHVFNDPPSVYDVTISGFINSDQPIKRITFTVVALNSSGEMLALARDDVNFNEAKGSINVYLNNPTNGVFNYTWLGVLYNKQVSSARVTNIKIDY